MYKKYSRCIVLMSFLAVIPSLATAEVVSMEELKSIMDGTRQRQEIIDKLAAEFKKAKTDKDVFDICSKISNGSYPVPGDKAGIAVLTSAGQFLAASMHRVTGSHYAIFSYKKDGQHAIREILNNTGLTPGVDQVIPILEGVGGPTLVRARKLRAGNGVDLIVLYRERLPQDQIVHNYDQEMVISSKS